MTELQIIQSLLCPGCNKPPEKLIVHSDYDTKSFVVTGYCCFVKETLLPFIDESILGTALYYGALMICCDYIVGISASGTPTLHDWQLVSRLFDKAFSSSESGTKTCTCGAWTADPLNPCHSSWCDIY